MKNQEIAIVKHDITAKQFVASVKIQLKLAGLNEITEGGDYDYFVSGNDIEFDVHHDESECLGCLHEVSICKPYHTETYIMNDDGTQYNEICVFTETDSKTHTGTGIYFLRNVQ